MKILLFCSNPINGGTAKMFYELYVAMERKLSAEGHEVLASVRRHLRQHDEYTSWTKEKDMKEQVVVVNSGYGEFPLLMALHHPDKTFVTYERDEEKRLLAKYSAEGLVNNLNVLPLEEMGAKVSVDSTVIVLDEDGGVLKFLSS